MEQPNPQTLKHFQLALSMVGISANLMTCELIKAISERCDEMGEAFNIGEANKIANNIANKYGKPAMPEGMGAPGNIPKSLQEMMDKGEIMMGSKKDFIPASEIPTSKTEEPTPPAQ